MKKVAIVGAGLTGLSAATKLQGAFEVTILEKSRGVSGRAATRRIEEIAFDHGAQYFTAYTQEVISLVQTWEEKGVIQQWNPNLVAIDSFSGEVTPKTNGPPRYVGVPTMTALAKHLAEGQNVIPSTFVKSIYLEDGKWVVETEQGRQSERFDAVIVTIPREQTQQILPEQFCSQIPQVTHDACWALIVLFDQPLETSFESAFVNNSEVLSWITANTKPGRTGGHCAWVIHAHKEWSNLNLELSPSEVQKPILEEFLRVVNLACPNIVELPQIKNAMAQRWRYSKPRNSENKGCVSFPEEKLVVCGDWMSGARIEGALTSGRISAETLLSIFNT